MKSFSEFMNRDKTDALDAKLSSYCDELETDGTHNIDICRRLIQVALVRMNKEAIESRAALVTDTRDDCQGILDRWKAMDEKFYER